MVGFRKVTLMVVKVARLGVTRREGRCRIVRGGTGAVTKIWVHSS